MERRIEPPSPDALGLAPTAADGVVLCGEVSLPDIDGWMLRANAVGMPLWGKCYSSAGIDDVLTGVVTLEDGFAAFGRIAVVPNIDSHPWILRTSVDEMASFTEASGLVTENTAVEWRRVRDHATGHRSRRHRTHARLLARADRIPFARRPAISSGAAMPQPADHCG